MVSAEPAIQANRLAKRFGSADALSEVSFEVRAGEIVGLLGPNGAGKTTTLRSLLGNLKPTQGEATVLGLDAARHAQAVKRSVGYCPDEPAFYDALTGRETLELVALAHGLTSAWARLEPLIERLAFADSLDVVTHGYSHGTKKKLALLCALIHAPKVLLLDEPTNGLDPATAVAVRQLIEAEARAGVAVLLSTHLLELAERMCPRIVVLRRGRVAAQGSPSELRAAAGLSATAPLEDAFLALVA